MWTQGENNTSAQPSASSASSREIPNPSKLPELKYYKLPNPTSIRLLDIVESESDKVRCEMRIMDLNSCPEYAALSYTWGNPVTVYEEPMPDTQNLKYPEDADKLPFTYSTPPLGPNGEALVVVDGPREDYGTQRSIEVNGCAVHVEENLFLYLVAVGHWRAQHARTGDDSDHVHDALRLPMWIDALCVNQTDLAERAAQVQLMKRIFKSASIVFAWIGQSDRLSSIATDAMEMILNYASTLSEAIFAPTHDSEVQRPELMDTSLSSIPGMSVAHWFALFSLLQRLYFRRAWIAQELIFSKSILMICSGGIMSITLLLTARSEPIDRPPLSDAGRHFMKLATFAETQCSPQIASASTPRSLEIEPRNAFSFILGYHRVRGRLGSSKAGMPLIRSRLVSSRVNSKAVHSWGVELPEHIKLSDQVMVEVEPGVFRFHRRPLRLLSVLSDFRNLDATDPRDKIFAFLNLATDDLGLIPDYCANVQDVFRKATEAMLKKTGTFSVLSQIQDPSETKIKGLPGWVPDFSARLERTPFDQDGEEYQFYTSSNFPTAKMHFNTDGTLGVDGFKVDTVSSVTDMEGDAIIQVLKLALKVPAHYPANPLAWWCKDHVGRHLRPRAVTRVEALWRTLVADQLTEMDEDYGTLDSRAGLSTGFVNWVITDILEARGLLVQYIDIDPDHWMVKLIIDSFCTRMCLWSAMYDERQISTFTNLRDLGGVLDDLGSKKQDEEDQYQPDQHLEIPSPRMGLEHFPTAHQIAACFRKHVQEPEDGEDTLIGSYRTSALLRLTQLERRQLRNFEKCMQEATEGRRLFCTEAGRFGLGPKPTGQDSQCTDQIWILNGAKVPFVLRWERENRYKIVGEAYVHGVMYGEETNTLQEIRLV
ncbi:hypothetical protein EPUS_09514 [Endocarpon pusillum Z07020]|uniref:Heterokaryon incompatibility domain-containing protein n=1 Tax=Endocarpon pusillum (strain Z07020 / HMAS-L-300199) TaxID=1263415 RepID=U1G914_ENDPU|nr:uncharacterized protein EPUS_09514 [Endocarpon pusillum Z07020]ERF68156.1 hypothetical protein EPUS_09514 [Endocarpon pusillum Z07020]